ncbi:MAG: hypothetical protein ACO2OV_01005 [Thermoproteota archaeon]|jgi:hypothetical protein
MDRAIIEVLITKGLLLFSIILLISTISIINIIYYSVSEIEIKALKSEIEKIVHKLYRDFNETGYSTSLFLMVNKMVSIKGLNNTIYIQIGSKYSYVYTPIKAIGEAYSNFIEFSLENSTIKITALSPIYISP